MEKILRWLLPPGPRAFGRRQIARGLASMRSVGCHLRTKGKCPYEGALFGCAECEARTTPPTIKDAPAK
jgi:hypothetical protein